MIIIWTTSLTYRRNKCRRKCIVRKSKQYTSFANSGITDQQQLEQQIVRLFCHFTVASC